MERILIYLNVYNNGGQIQINFIIFSSFVHVWISAKSRTFFDTKCTFTLYVGMNGRVLECIET